VDVLNRTEMVRMLVEGTVERALDRSVPGEIQMRRTAQANAVAGGTSNGRWDGDTWTSWFRADVGIADVDPVS